MILSNSWLNLTFVSKQLQGIKHYTAPKIINMKQSPMSA